MSLVQAYSPGEARRFTARRNNIRFDRRNPQPSGGISNPNEVTSATKRSWHRADLGIVPGTGVASWVDQFGNGYDVAQATGLQQPTAGATIAGQPALAFSRAASQSLTLTDAPRITALAGGTDTPFTVYVVLSLATLDTTTSPFGFSGAATTYTYPSWPASGAYTVNRRDGVSSLSTTYTGIAAATATPVLLRVRYSGTACELIHNGITGTPAGALDTGIMNLTTMAIGSSSRAAALNFLNGSIAEIIMFTGLVSAAEESRLVSQYFIPRYPGVA